MNWSGLRLRSMAGLLILAVLLGAFAGCTSAPASPTATSNTTATTGPGGGTIVYNDSIVECQIKAFGNTASSLTEVDVLIINSQDVDGLANETADKVNKVITVRTDEKLSSYVADEYITAHIQLAGDVEHGTYLYMYDIKPVK
jgi:hypothetical protein